MSRFNEWLRTATPEQTRLYMAKACQVPDRGNIHVRLTMRWTWRPIVARPSDHSAEWSEAEWWWELGGKRRR